MNITAEKMQIALAIEAYCNREFRALTSEEMLTGMKFAAMLRMGIDDETVMVAAVEGAENLDWPTILATARILVTDTDQQRLLGIIERAARTIVLAYQQAGGTA